MNGAPSPLEPSAPQSAKAAPAQAPHSGTPTRRAVLAGALVALTRPALADTTLEAGPDGYDGKSPGPILRGRVGEPLRLTIVNRLDAPTSFAWRGLCAPPVFPGLTGGPLAPGERRTLDFTTREPGFALYGAYGGQPGLFGAVVVDEPAAPPVDLDAVVVFGPDLRVNGVPAPFALTARPGGRVRLRLANAAPDVALTVVTAQSAQVVAIDGQPCEMFAPRAGALPLCPSARIELMLDLGAEGAEFTVEDRPVLRFAASGERAPERPAIAALPANPRLPRAIALEKALRVAIKLTPDFKIDGFSGAGWPRRPLFEVRRGRPVALTVTNETAVAQTLRLEGHWARRLHDLDDGWDAYWRDALYIEPARTLHAAFVADAPGKWPLASASPAMRARGMAAWCLVT